MDSDEKKFLAGCAAWCVGCFVVLFGSIVLVAAALAVAVKVFKFIAH